MADTACLAKSPSIAPVSLSKTHFSNSSSSLLTPSCTSNGNGIIPSYPPLAAASLPTTTASATSIAAAGGTSILCNNLPNSSPHVVANSPAPIATPPPNVANIHNGLVPICSIVTTPPSNGTPLSNGCSPVHEFNAISTAFSSHKLANCNGHSPSTIIHKNGLLPPQPELPTVSRPCLWYEEEIDENLRWCFGLNRILHTGVTKYQEIALLETQPFGKVLTLDKKMQSAEKDEWVYHECLVHPALLLHSSPKNVFIMGGGEGSTAREALRHRWVKKVVMCDIDDEVVRFCSKYLTMNSEAFQSKRLQLVINDARAELESCEERFDVIIGDLADPVEGGPCYQLYSKGFYETVLKPRMNPGGIFVTQAGPAGILSHQEVFSSIFNTLRNVFKHVVAYTAHIPSFADTWGWVMASDQPFNQVTSEELDARIKQRVKGELRYLDGATLFASTVLNKMVRQSLANEKHVYTEDSARFVYGHGRSTNAH